MILLITNYCTLPILSIYVSMVISNFLQHKKSCKIFPKRACTCICTARFRSYSKSHASCFVRVFESKTSIFKYSLLFRNSNETHALVFEIFLKMCEVFSYLSYKMTSGIQSFSGLRLTISIPPYSDAFHAMNGFFHF